MFSRRFAEVLPAELRPVSRPVPVTRPAGLVDGTRRRALQEEVTPRSGVLRSAGGLRRCVDMLGDLGAPESIEADQDAWETTKLLTVSPLLARAASLREETRGSHWREDFPARDDLAQSGHHDWWLELGETRHAFRPTRATDPSRDLVR